MTRHGVEELPDHELERVWRAEQDAEDEEMFEATIREKYPEDEWPELREQGRMHRERRWWEGDDWPRPQPGEKPDSVAILGFGPSRLLAPFGEPGWELWCLNDPDERQGIPARHAFTRWFQLHPPRYLSKHYERGLGDLASHWGEPTGVRLYMDRHYPEYPDSEPYPKAEVEALVPYGWYHASSFDWMVALAVLEGFKRIKLYGCMFYAYPLTNGEPLSALPALHYWMGVAAGRGIEIEVVGNSGHMFRVLHFAVYDSKLQYGWDREPALDLGKDSAGSQEGRWRDMR